MNEKTTPLRTLRLRAGMKQTEVAKLCGVTNATISNWENGLYDIDNNSLRILSEHFHVTPGYLLGVQEKDRPWIPVLGDVAAGIPITVVEDASDDYEQIDGDPAEFFALRLKGDSMEPRMKSGDVVIVHRQPITENGEIAVVKVGLEEATVKKVKIDETGVWLIPLNPAYSPQFYPLQDVRALPVTIVGKVVELRAKF